MRLFDLHCDTITECYARGEDLRSNTLQVSLEKGGAFSAWCQAYAVFLPDTMRGKAAVDYFEAVLAFYHRQLVQNPELRPVDSAGDLEWPRAAMLSVESGAVLAGELARVEAIYRQGVKMMTLTWNGANELGCGAMEPSGEGLTSFGKEAVREMDRLSMAVDVSHLSDKGFWDVCRVIDGPFAASHSNARAVCPHPRNLKDEQIREIIRRGGLIGLNLYVDFLGEGAMERGCEALYRHVDHMLELGGENVLSIGADYDGAVPPQALSHVGKLPCFALYLQERGYSEELTDKILYKNACDFFRKVLLSQRSVI